MKCSSCGIDNPAEASYCMACGSRLTSQIDSFQQGHLGFSTSFSFVGRQRELSELSACLEQAREGRGGLVMLSGEPGIGKTRTAQEFSNHAYRQGARVFWGRCYEEQGMPPYWPWVQAVRSYIRQQDPERLRSEMGNGAGDVADIIVDVRERLPDLPQLPRLDNPDQARFRLFDSITAFLRAASHENPMVIVLDDLHWADQSSLMLLQFLARELEGSRILLVGTYRDMELSRQHPLTETLGDLAREQLFNRVQLRGLNEEDIARFIEAMSGVGPSTELVQMAYQQTEGNPLFVAEIVRLITQESRLYSDPRSEYQGNERLNTARLGVPQGVKEVIGRRLNRLSPECNNVLTVAAVIGREFSLEQLRAVIQDLSEDELLEALEASLAVQVIEELPSIAERYQFTHALIQESLSNELSITRRIRVHARIANALEELYGDNAKGHAAELTFHFAEAVTIAGVDKLVHYSLLAGEQALASYAHREALELFRRALSAKEVEPGPPAPDAESAELLYGFGRAQVATLPVYQLHEAVTSLRSSFDYYVQVDDVARAVAIAEIPFPPAAGHPTGMAQLTERALELVPPDSPAAGRLLATFGWLMGMEQGDYQRGSGAMSQGLDIARKELDVEVELKILVNNAELEAYNHHWPVCLDRALAAVALTDSVDDPRSESLAHYWAAFMKIVLGDPAGASQHMSYTWEAAERLRHHFYIARSSFINQVWNWLLGDWTTAREYSVRGLASSPDDDRLLAHRVILECEAGDFSAARHHLDQFIEYMRHTPDGPLLGHSYLAVAIANFSWLSGDHQYMGVGRDSANQILGSPIATPVITMWAHIATGKLAMSEGDLETVQAQLEFLRQHHGTMVIPDTMAVDRLLGLLADALGQEEEAIGHFERALSFCRRAGYRSEVAWTGHDYANLLLRSPFSKSGADALKAKEQCRSLLDESLTIGRELGMVSLVEKVSGLLGRLGVSTDVTTAYPDGLSHREVEVLRLVASGRSNRQIADELFISLRTVASHVTNILSKTGAANRAEAATYASRQGLV